MLHKSWKTSLKFSLTLLLAISLNTMSSPFSHAEVPTSSGPRSVEEAQTLWESGKKAVLQSDWNETIRLLQRLVDRYPGQAGYLDAHYFLGKAYWHTQRASKSILPLKHYIAATQKSAREIPLTTLQAKLLLARSFLSLKKSHECYLLTQEIERSFEIPPQNSTSELPLSSKSLNLIQAEALLIRAQSLFQTHKRIRSEKTLDYAETLLNKIDTSLDSSLQNYYFTLRGEAIWFAVKLKLSHCAEFPSKKALPEAQAKHQLERKGQCLLEALNLLQNALPLPSHPTLQETTDLIDTHFQAYWNHCNHPPAPVKIMNDTDQKHYQKELAEMLRTECKTVFKNARSFLETWKAIDKIELNTQNTLQQLSNKLRKTADL